MSVVKLLKSMAKLLTSECKVASEFASYVQHMSRTTKWI